MRVSNGLDTDQEQQNFVPDLGPNCCKGNQRMTKSPLAGKDLRILQVETSIHIHKMMFLSKTFVLVLIGNISMRCFQRVSIA